MQKAFQVTFAVTKSDNFRTSSYKEPVSDVAKGCAMKGCKAASARWMHGIAKNIREPKKVTAKGSETNGKQGRSQGLHEASGHL